MNLNELQTQPQLHDRCVKTGTSQLEADSSGCAVAHKDLRRLPLRLASFGSVHQRCWLQQRMHRRQRDCGSASPASCTLVTGHAAPLRMTLIVSESGLHFKSRWLQAAHRPAAKHLRGFLRAGESSGSSRGEAALSPCSRCTLVRLSRAACSALSASSCQPGARLSWLMLLQVLVHARHHPICVAAWQEVLHHG